MKQKSGPDKAPADQVLKNIRRQTRRQYSAEEKIRIVLEGLRGEENISELCRREGIAASMYYGWSKEFLEAGKWRSAGGLLQARRLFGCRIIGHRELYCLAGDDFVGGVRQFDQHPMRSRF